MTVDFNMLPNREKKTPFLWGCYPKGSGSMREPLGERFLMQGLRVYPFYHPVKVIFSLKIRASLKHIKPQKGNGQFLH